LRNVKKLQIAITGLRLLINVGSTAGSGEVCHYEIGVLNSIDFNFPNRIP
jgi:hypothetical protein